MAGVIWTVAAVGFLLTADCGWSAVRDWRARRRARRLGRTLTAKFALSRF